MDGPPVMSYDSFASPVFLCTPSKASHTCGAVSPEPAHFPGPSPMKLFFGSRQETAMRSSELCVKAAV